MTLVTVRHVLTVEKNDKGKEYMRSRKKAYDILDYDTRVEYTDNIMSLVAKKTIDIDEESATCD